MITKINKSNLSIITKKKYAVYEYFIKQEFEAGLSLYGWEAKSLRIGNTNISESYINIKNNEAYLINATINPIMINLSSHSIYEASRIRKLLLKKNELNILFGFTNLKKYTIIPLSLYWKNYLVKVKIGIAESKKKYQTREKIKKYEWQIEKMRLMKKIIK